MLISLAAVKLNEGLNNVQTHTDTNASKRLLLPQFLD